jgi:hypothetical protein
LTRRPAHCGPDTRGLPVLILLMSALARRLRQLCTSHCDTTSWRAPLPRLSRYDETGLIWLLRGRPVVALAERTAAIENPTDAITVYRKNNKPTLGPVGDQ